MSEQIYLGIIGVCVLVIIFLLISKRMQSIKLRTFEKSSNELVSNIAHEFKTPMTSIVGFVETLQNGAINDPEKATRFLDIIAVESARLGNIVEATLEISRLENLEEDQNITTFDFDEVVKQCVELLQHNADNDDIKINVYYKKSGTVMVKANKTRIKQVLVNLVGNAIKYNKQGGRVDINIDTQGKNLIIDVYNTGRGISYEHINRLFERFYRVDDGRTRDVGGTGLGLAIVRKIINLYHGRIEVESQLGIDATFTVTLPICKS